MREIIYPVLDDVDKEICNRRLSWREVSWLPGNKWAAAMAKIKLAYLSIRLTNGTDAHKSNGQKKETTMQDVLVRRQGMQSVRLCVCYVVVRHRLENVQLTHLFFSFGYYLFRKGRKEQTERKRRWRRATTELFSGVTQTECIKAFSFVTVSCLAKLLH